MYKIVRLKEGFEIIRVFSHRIAIFKTTEKIDKNIFKIFYLTRDEKYFIDPTNVFLLTKKGKEHLHTVSSSQILKSNLIKDYFIILPPTLTINIKAEDITYLEGGNDGI